MSVTMEHGLIDQAEKFQKRVASANISQYKKVYRNELVVGFPIDEGALGFQLRHTFAAVSPAYGVWRLREPSVDIEFLDILLRSQVMRDEYRLKMQGAVDRRRSIDKDVFLSIEIPMPPAPVRRAVVEKRKQMDKAAERIKALEYDVATNLRELWEIPDEDARSNAGVQHKEATMTKDKPTVRVRPATYQPSKAELEDDMAIDTTPEELARIALQPMTVKVIDKDN